MNSVSFRNNPSTTALRFKYILAAVVCALTFSFSPSAYADEPVAASDTAWISVNPGLEEMFLNMTVSAADLLPLPARETLINHWTDGKRPAEVFNSYNTVSSLDTLSENYLRLSLTKVSDLTLNRLFNKKKETVLVLIYTVGDDGTAPDSEISFYDKDWNQFETKKLWEAPEAKDFLMKDKDGKGDLKKIETLIPFPTFEFTSSADGKIITGRMTVGEYLSEESKKEIAPYLVQTRKWEWDGEKYRLQKLRK